MKMNAIAYTLISIAITCFVFIAFFNENNKKSVFRCSHSLSIDIIKYSGHVQFRTNTTYIYYRDGTGFKIDVGTMNVNGKNYILNRRYKTYYHRDGKNIDLIVAEVNKTNKDTAPEDVSLLQHNKKISYHTTIQRLYGGAYLIKVQGFPVAVCT